MLIDIALFVVSSFFSIIAIFLPNAEALSPEVLSSMATLGTYIFMMNQLIAIDTLFAAIAIVIVFEVTLAGVNLARWIVRSTPFLNSRI